MIDDGRDDGGDDTAPIDNRPDRAFLPAVHLDPHPLEDVPWRTPDEARAALAADLAAAAPEANAADRAARWMLRAARLAALGDDSHLRAWPRLLNRRFDALGLLREAANRGAAAFIDAEGAALATALIDAQDAVCLAAREASGDGLLVAAAEDIARWTDAAATAVTDDLATAFLQRFVIEHPLPHDTLLPPLAHPLGDAEREALARATVPTPVVRVAPIPVFEEELVFDIGIPTERMRQRFAERRGTIDRPGGTVRVRALLEPDWSILVHFDGEAISERGPDAVRLGTRAAEPAGESRDAWVVRLDGLDLDTRTRLVVSPIVVRFDDGRRYEL